MIAPSASPSRPVVARLAYRPPLAARELLQFLGARAVPGVEEVDGEAFRRSLRLPGGAGVAELRAVGAELRVRLWLDDRRDAAAALERCHALVDADADPRAVADELGHDAVLGPSVRRAPGRRVPGTVDGHELAVRAVLGQQVSLAGAATVAGRLVAAYGEPLKHPVGGVTHLFPAPEALAAAEPEAWAMPAARVRAVRSLSAAVAARRIALDPGADRDETGRRLLALPGIGPWTAGYVAMRALRDPDAFLAGDLGVRRALERLGLAASPAAADRLAERWRPFRSYAVQHLWASA